MQQKFEKKNKINKKVGKKKKKNFNSGRESLGMYRENLTPCHPQPFLCGGQRVVNLKQSSLHKGFGLGWLCKAKQVERLQTAKSLLPGDRGERKGHELGKRIEGKISLVLRRCKGSPGMAACCLHCLPSTHLWD